MESLSRPPHRRRPSSTNASAFASVSLRNPYDDVLFSGARTKARPFGAHEYSEIFAGSSSSIPVLDLPGLDERVVSGECRSSKLDYSNIFGGLRDDDLAVPYEELFIGAKKPKRSNDEPGIPVNAGLPVLEPESPHSSGKAEKSSAELADQTVDGVKQQFSLSFNKTSQKINDVSKGKTHIAQLHAVPGFTFFIDGTQQVQRKEADRCVPLLKREVSRTWSFSADVEAIKGKGGSGASNSHTPDMPHIVPPPSSNPCTSRELDDSEGSNTCSFQTKEDASGKMAGDSLPPLFEEDIDESSIAGVSAAALKKAIEQAQESIRIAKMIMEKKKESVPDGSKPRPKSCSKVKDKKENNKDTGTNSCKEKSDKITYERLDPIFNAFKDLDEKIDLSLGRHEKISDPGKARDNFEAAEEGGKAFNWVINKFATSSSQSEALCNMKRIELKELGNNVKAVEAHEGAMNSPGIEVEVECWTANSDYGQLIKNNDFVMSVHKLTSYVEEMGTTKESSDQNEVAVPYTKGSEAAADPAERAVSTSQMTQELGNIVDVASEIELTFIPAKGLDTNAVLAERSPCISPSTFVQVNVDEVSANLRISKEDEMIDTEKSEIDNLRERGIIFEEHEEMVNVENLKFPDLRFDNLMNDPPITNKREATEQDEMEKKSMNVPDWREIGQRHGISWDEEQSGIRFGEAQASFESKELLNETLEESTNKREPGVFPEIEEVIEKVTTVHEILNNLRDEDGIMLQRELEQSESDESQMENFENEVAETKQLEGNNFAEVQKIEVSPGSDKTSILRIVENSKENQGKPVFQEVACEIDMEVHDAKEANTISSEIHSNNSSTILSATEEPSDIDLNNRVEENGSTAGVAEIFSSIETEEKAKKPFHLEENDNFRTARVHRSTSEDNLISSNMRRIVEGLSFDCQNENFGTMNTNDEEKPPVVEDTLETTVRSHRTAQEIAGKFNMQNLPEVHDSDYRTDYDLNDVRLVSEQTSESDGRSESTTSLENIDGNESETFAETKSETSDEEEIKDGETTSDKINCIQSAGAYSEENVEPKEMAKSTEAKRTMKTGEVLEKVNENTGETSTMEEKHAKENVKILDKDQQRRIEAIKKGRAREKDRIAAERAMREARERAFAEAQVRAERAATERAATEVRQKSMVEAQDRLAKVSISTNLPSDKVSTEAKLRAERAAVERATAEARERALEKAMSLKSSTVGRSHTDRSGETSRNNGLKHSFSSSDLEKIDGTSNESAKRSKAILERHQRIMERAAKALAEKNMRDLLAQKEQAERNRLAESLDADIKRWVMGKEGNVRALLSTLQYILGPNSGWQPISLTEIITTPAVKKAYRKATLYVHPDKLQQRGASIQQKYICEKVFDLLKAAWNKFNSEER